MQIGPLKRDKPLRKALRRTPSLLKHVSLPPRFPSFSRNGASSQACDGEDPCCLVEGNLALGLSHGYLGGATRLSRRQVEESASC